MTDSNAVYYYHFDGLGSVVAISDVNAVVVETYSYDVFGEVTINDPNGATRSASDYDNPYYFTGRRLDEETGLYYYRARMYKPEIGRFLQPDPIGYAAGMNIYTYCGNNPTNWIDPSGLFRFGKTDLSRLPKGSRKLTYESPLLHAILDFTNQGLYHEHGFFEDGSHENIGYFGPNPDTGEPGGIKSGKNCDKGGENPDDYDIDPWQYDDDTMRNAIRNVGNSGNFDPVDYALFGNNCQDYKTALKKEYKRLGGKIRYRPFGRRKRF